MMETSEERIKLLREGFSAKAIEKVYIESNNFKIIPIPVLLEIIKFELLEIKKTCKSREAAAGCA